MAATEKIMKNDFYRDIKRMTLLARCCAVRQTTVARSLWLYGNTQQARNWCSLMGQGDNPNRNGFYDKVPEILVQILYLECQDKKERFNPLASPLAFLRM